MNFFDWLGLGICYALALAVAVLTVYFVVRAIEESEKEKRS